MVCPRCGTRPVTQTACPTCGQVLKARGHPGVNLYTAPVGEVLCATCHYHLDQTCDLPNYPEATECTLYRDSRKASRPPFTYRPRQSWGWLVWLGLVGVSIALALR
ncbi:hypothetical protein [Candidatus Cyanaurora vandensis]|uniref:hypothetical protein n=1 Tax=Candidatus Cyanaurora vandensis TaxID=2714958 RepID=UPI00257A8A36|nr:hypothetical protein [Candidatus Cyanaurora vandensis]